MRIRKANTCTLQHDIVVKSMYSGAKLPVFEPLKQYLVNLSGFQIPHLKSGVKNSASYVLMFKKKKKKCLLLGFVARITLIKIHKMCRPVSGK